MRRLKHLVVGVVVGGVLAALALIWQAGVEIHRWTGPSKLASAADGHVWLLSHGQVHEFDAAGQRVQAIAMAELKLPDAATEFVRLSTGELLIAEPETPAIHRCDPTQRRCQVLAGGAGADHGCFDQALWLAVDEAAGRLYVADSGNHRLLLFDLRGRLLDKTDTAGGRLDYPNHIALSAPGRLRVVDTGHRRVVDVDVAGDRFGADLADIPTANDLAGPGRKRPMLSAQMPDGRLWVVLADANMGQGSIVVFDPQGRAEHRLELDDAADPVGLAWSGQRVLIADRDGFRVRQATLDGRPLEDFGDAGFQDELRRQRDRVDRWRMIQFGSQIGVAAVPVLGILLLLLMGERLELRRPGANALRFDQAPRAVSGTTWLTARPEFARQQKRLLAAFAVASLLMILALYWVATDLGGVPERAITLLGALVGLTTVVVAVTLHTVARRARSRLGTDGQSILHDPGDGIIRRHPLRTVKSDGRHLLLGRTLLPIHAPMHSPYDREEVETLLLARLPAAARHSQVGLFIAALRAGHPGQWAVIVMALLLVAVQFLGTIQPDWLTALLSGLSGPPPRS